MSRFDSVPDIEGRLNDFEIQCKTDWLGDPLRNILDQSVERDIFKPYEEGERFRSLIRLATYISALITRMLVERKVYSLKEKSIEELRLVDLIKLLKKHFRGEICSSLIRDLHIIRKLRNAYAHGLTPVQDIFRNEHRLILEAIRNTWQDLRNEYVKVVI